MTYAVYQLTTDASTTETHIATFLIRRDAERFIAMMLKVQPSNLRFTLREVVA